MTQRRYTRRTGVGLVCGLVLASALLLGVPTPAHAATLLSDSFNRGPSPTLGTLDSGQTWADIDGAFSITSSNQATAADTSSTTHVALANAGTANGTVKITHGADSNGNNMGHAGVVFRADATGTHYFTFNRVNSEEAFLQKVNGGTTTTIFHALSFVGGETMEAVANGPRLVIRRGGTVIGAWTDSFNQTLTNFGIASLAGPTTLDDFSVTDDLTDNPGGTLATTPLIVFDGDSRTAGAGFPPQKDSQRLIPMLIKDMDPTLNNDYLNWGIAGRSQAIQNTDAPTNIDPKYDPTRPANVVVTWGGVNDLFAPTDPQTVYNSIRQYCLARRAVGWKVIVATILPGGNPPGNTDIEDGRLQLNSLIRNNWQTFADGLADVGSDVLIGQYGDQNPDYGYYLDTLHLTQAGNAIAETYFKTALQPLVAKLPYASVVTDKPGIQQTGTLENITATISNPTDQNFTNIRFKQPLTGLDFVPGSVSINGVPQANADPTTGINVSPLQANGSLVITFQATIDSGDAQYQNLVNQATYNYDGSNCPATDCTTNLLENIVGDPLAARLNFVQVSAAAGGQVTVRWTAAREVSNIGYMLYGINAAGAVTALTAHLVPSHNALDQAAGIYSATVTIPADTQRIRIDDVAAGGQTMPHGPYALDSTTGKAPAATPAASAAPQSRPAAAPQSLALAQNDAALAIATSGIYHLDYAALTAQGLNLQGVNPARLALSSGGKSLPIYVKTAHAKTFAPGDYIEFAAQAVDTFYTGSNSYVLTARSVGDPRHLRRPPSIAPRQSSKTPPATVVTQTLPGRRYYWNAAPATASPWTWALLENDIPALADQTVTFDLPHLYAAGAWATKQAQVTLHLRGWNGYAAINPDHHAVADLNGTAHADVTFHDNNTATLTLTVPASALKETGNTLRLRAPGDIAGVQYDTMILDSIGVTYPQTTALPPLVTQVAGLRAAYRAADVAKSIVAQAGGNSLDYVIIAAPDFVAGVAPLAAQHRAEGLRVATVDVNAVYDVYSNGIVDPAVIQTFIAALQKTRGLRYVLLVGADSYDPRGYIAGDAPSYIPAFRSPDTLGTWAASDATYADTDGDGLPDVALGRLPVRTAAELATLVTKIGTFGSATAPATATFVSDPVSPMFAAISTSAGAGLPKTVPTTRITWKNGDSGPASAALLAQWQAGSRIIAFTGHSNVDVWADDEVLNGSALGNLNTTQPALVTVWGCWAATFDRADAEGLSQLLLGGTTGGAAAVIGSTTEVGGDEYGPTPETFYKALFAGGNRRIGDALLSAKRAVLTANRTWRDLAQGLTLLGDPAARV